MDTIGEPFSSVYTSRGIPKRSRGPFSKVFIYNDLKSKSPASQVCTGTTIANTSGVSSYRGRVVRHGRLAQYFVNIVRTDYILALTPPDVPVW